ncbi:hypothetical protein [Halovivax limisalsi]|uniref:hypothetical protein n=1 Tax=Halovivax limisalsi TaxID=1453760 RepID=UPI001FFDE09B|nr:hypothetical protein [Halovivax limisalsi]
MHDSNPPPPLSTLGDGQFDTGHLWLLEQVDGPRLRFQLDASGLVRVGDAERVYDDPTDVPLPLRHAVRHVREHLDRDGLRAAVDDVDAVTFVGVATARRAIDYDWERVAPFLGVDVRTADGYRPPDAVAAIFDRLGLETVPVVERERRARDFDPDAIDFPASDLYDGPVAGLSLRDKRGGRAALSNPAVDAPDPPTAVDAPDLAAAYAADSRFERLARALESSGRSVDYDALVERTVEAIAREMAPQFADVSDPVDPAALRRAVGERAQQFLADRDRWG